MKTLTLKIENVTVANFKQVYNATYKLVNGIVFRSVNDLELTKDLTQEIFLKVLNEGEKYNPKYNINTWVGNIAKNYVIDYFRKKKLDAISVDKQIGNDGDGMTVLETINNHEVIAVDTLISAEQRIILRNAIKVLRGAELKCVMAYFYSNLSYAEIEAKYNIPLNSVKVYILRGKEKIKAELQKRGY